VIAYLIQGKEGCIFGKTNHLGIVVVDALRASATAIMLLHSGAKRILVTDEVAHALHIKSYHSNALLYGERNGLPPAGFDYGNSPRETTHARGKEVIFTTTTGARLLIEGYDEAIPFLIMATTINAKAVSNFLKKQNKDFVVVPAGLFDDVNFSAQEDWVAGSYIVSLLDVQIEHGKDDYEYWKEKIDLEGIEQLFNSAPHADKLRKIGLHEDIRWCSQTNISNCIPKVVKKEKEYIILENIGSY